MCRSYCRTRGMSAHMIVFSGARLLYFNAERFRSISRELSEVNCLNNNYIYKIQAPTSISILLYY